MPSITVLEAKYVYRSKLDELLRRTFSHDYGIRVHNVDADALWLLLLLMRRLDLWGPDRDNRPEKVDSSEAVPNIHFGDVIG